MPCLSNHKKNGNIRLVVDYRAINKVTQPDVYSFPNMHDEIRSIPRSEWFSQIDLSMGYHQIEINAEDRKYTSFTTQFGQYEYTRVPFGLTNAPRVFQRIIHQVLSGLSFVKTFLDDILVFSKTREQHLRHLEDVLNRLSKNNISLALKKAISFKRK